MASDWKKSVGNVRSVVGNALGGLRGGSNLASWVVAGTLAYFLWVKPSQELKKEQQERAALAAASDRYRYVEKVKPVPDLQVIRTLKEFVHANKCCTLRATETGLIYGNKNKTKDSEK